MLDQQQQQQHIFMFSFPIMLSCLAIEENVLNSAVPISLHHANDSEKQSPLNRETSILVVLKRT